MKAILQAESAYQTAVNSAYMELGDDTFKQLRRALPVTKQKIDWNNIKTKIVLDDKWWASSVGCVVLLLARQALRFIYTVSGRVCECVGVCGVCDGLLLRYV